VAVTVTPGTALPLVSCTEPSIVPVVDVCAITIAGRNDKLRATTSDKANCLVVFIFLSFLLLQEA
jgi:hypothetical protein